MPYIKQEDRERATSQPATAGELNYAITRRTFQYFAGYINVETLTGEITHLCEAYIYRVGMSYTNIIVVIGVLYCCGMELVRRTYRNDEANLRAIMASIQFRLIARLLYRDLAIPYEDIKIIENGDVFPEEFIS